MENLFEKNRVSATVNSNKKVQWLEVISTVTCTGCPAAYSRTIVPVANLANGKKC